MAYDEELAGRVRAILEESPETAPELTEKKMFGGLAFLIRGNMSCGVNGSDLRGDLMVRVGPEAYEEALSRPHARLMDFTGRPLKGFVYVAAEGIADEDGLREWVGLGARFALSLPAK